MGSVFIKDISIRAKIGVSDIEREIGIPVLISFSAESSLKLPSETDLLGVEHVDYLVVAGIIKRECSKPHKLLEAFAHGVAAAINERYPKIEIFEIKVAKQRPFVEIGSSEAGIIFRYPEDF